MHSRTRKSHSAIVLAMTLAMTACGGGGGSGIRPDPSPEPASPEPTSPELTSPELTGDDVLLADPGATGETVQRAATALPRHGSAGSVTQSYSVDVSGVSSDAAEVGVDNGIIFLTVTRDAGSRFTLNSDDHAYASESIPRSETLSRQGPATEVDMSDITDGAATMAGIWVEEWEPGYGEWLALGLWLHLEGDIEDGSIRGVRGVEVGAFVDGPELDGIPSLPPAGTATYSGIADGVHAGEYGTDGIVDGVPQGSQLVGTYTGDLTLVADFGAGPSESGTIGGHIDNIEIDELVVTPSGDEIHVVETMEDRIELGAVPIDSDGSFSGRTVRLTHPDGGITSSEGAWGGKFSTIADGNGDPRLVAGTHGVNATFSGGSELTMIGVFYGVTEEALAQP